MGKHNIEVEERKGIAADFYKAGEHLRITLRQGVLEKIRRKLVEDKEEPVEALMIQLIAAPDADLLKIS